jgi:hypothetical protein
MSSETDLHLSLEWGAIESFPPDCITAAEDQNQQSSIDGCPHQSSLRTKDEPELIESFSEPIPLWEIGSG